MTISKSSAILVPTKEFSMVAGGNERTAMLEHPLADQFRVVIEGFGGTNEVADNLLSRLRSIEAGSDGHITLHIYREADQEKYIGDSWVSMEFNPNRKSVMMTIFVGGLVRRELAKDLLDRVRAVKLRDEDVVFLNEAGRMLWLNKDNKVVSGPF